MRCGARDLANRQLENSNAVAVRVRQLEITAGRNRDILLAVDWCRNRIPPRRRSVTRQMPQASTRRNSLSTRPDPRVPTALYIREPRAPPRAPAPSMREKRCPRRVGARRTRKSRKRANGPQEACCVGDLVSNGDRVHNPRHPRSPERDRFGLPPLRTHRDQSVQVHHVIERLHVD